MKFKPSQILDFWFSKETKENWWIKDDAFDDIIRGTFMGHYEAASKGKLRQWEDTPESALALILCLDQFPRNMFRNTPNAFATDEQARAVAGWAVDRDYDMTFPNADQRVFFYLPFEHSEDIEDQHRAVELTRTRCEDENYLSYAIAHCEVIAEFDRFPHRNAILGRENTADEEEYLAKPGAGF